MSNVLAKVVGKSIKICLPDEYGAKNRPTTPRRDTIEAILRQLTTSPAVQMALLTTRRKTNTEWDQKVTDPFLLAVNSLIEIASKGERAVSWVGIPVKLRDLYCAVKAAQYIVDGRETYSRMGSKMIVINWIARNFTTTEQHNQSDPAKRHLAVVVVFPDGSTCELFLPKKTAKVSDIYGPARKKFPLPPLKEWSPHQEFAGIVNVDGNPIPITVSSTRKIGEVIEHVQLRCGVGAAELRLDGTRLQDWKRVDRIIRGDGFCVDLVETDAVSDDMMDVKIQLMTGAETTVTVSGGISIDRLMLKACHQLGILNEIVLFLPNEEEPVPRDAILRNLGTPTLFFGMEKTSPAPTDGTTRPVKPLDKDTRLSDLPRQVWNDKSAVVLHVAEHWAICSLPGCNYRAAPWYDGGVLQLTTRLCQWHHYESD